MSEANDTYELMEVLFPEIHSLRPLDNAQDMKEFQYWQEIAERVLKAGYRKCPE